ncbi:DNA-formamidopyrimidine glycosylase family protein [Rathayibacter oskolensis]|uniref:DNA-formamidopyrimidine glycosylase family protein n=1 Tax=Rathayibacter oskolensis TaxID=1891671 RepID=UPI00265DE6C0|nr:DNA-formamidopyrimidine glycosylase family protein [Rathayibacter oskolensis]WKK71539.1 DNA-formamidopyrimidine glycosylase family protein [Rathayibacter oskolensis]
MPELPEVEVVRAGLAPAVTGSLVTGVEIVDERSLKRHVHAHPFERLLVGRRLQGAVRRGKFLWLPAGREEALLVHLGMSGQVLLRTADAPLARPDAHPHRDREPRSRGARPALRRPAHLRLDGGRCPRSHE